MPQLPRPLPISPPRRTMHSAARRLHLPPPRRRSSMLTPFRFAFGCTLLTTLLIASAVFAGDPQAEPTAKDAQPLIDKAMAFLKTQQADDGSWSSKRAGPGITALVVAGLLRNGQSPKDPMIARAITYLEKSVQKDGG